MVTFRGVVGVATVAGRDTHLASLSGLTGQAQDGVITLSGLVTDRPYRLAKGVKMDLDFAISTSRRAGVLRTEGAVVVSYDYPRISIKGKGIKKSSIKSLTRGITNA